MKIEKITLRQLRMPLVHFFETSFSRTYSRDIIIVEVHSEGISGWDWPWSDSSAPKMLDRTC